MVLSFGFVSQIINLFIFFFKKIFKYRNIFEVSRNTSSDTMVQYNMVAQIRGLQSQNKPTLCDPKSLLYFETVKALMKMKCDMDVS